MFNTQLLDNLAQRLTNLLPSGFDTLRADLQQNFRSVLQGFFNKLDLVTREEFDVQVAVLVKTRAKLEKLEQQIAAYEQQFKQSND